MNYYKFINRMLKDRIVDNYIHLSAQVPGNLTDPKKGFKRFDRWYKLPDTAWKLYWRTHGNRT